MWLPRCAAPIHAPPLLHSSCPPCPRNSSPLLLPPRSALLLPTNVWLPLAVALLPAAQVTKRYRALVWGRLEGRGRVTWKLDERHCDTQYAAVQHTLVDVAALGLGSGLPGAAAGAAVAGAEAAGADVTMAAAGAEAAVLTSDSAAAGADVAMAAAGSRAAVLASDAAARADGAAYVTTVDLWPHTGRKHQLRRHMALIGHPLVGDKRYTFGYAAARRAVGLPMQQEGHELLPADEPAACTAGEAAGVSAVTLADGSAAGAVEVAGAGSGCDMPAVVAAATAAHGLKLCLWAVELHLERHPASGQHMHFVIPEPAAFEAVRTALAGTSS